MGLLPTRRRRESTSNAVAPRPHAALKITPGAFDSIEGGTPLMPFIATPPGQGRAAREAFNQSQSATYAWIYRTQPAVRKVVDYIARNAAQMGVKLYQRTDGDDREEVRDHPAIEALRRPAGMVPGRRFMFGLIADFLIYENAYALKLRADERLALIRVPVSAVQLFVPATSLPAMYRVQFRDGTVRDFPPDQVLHLSGYDPDDAAVGISRLETLRQILTEEAMNQAANQDRLKHGGLNPGYLSRPLEAPDWEDPARERFMSDWKERSKGKKDGERSDPILEEGMEFHESQVTPKDAEMLASRIFTRSEVASLYGLPAILVEAEEGGEGNDRKEARTQFYADTLPPILGPIQDDLDVQVLDVEYDAADDHYFEFNLAEKLRGQVEERFKVLTNAAGGPILTRNEARKRENLPPVPGGDELITPLNVTVGGKPSTGTMPAQDPNGVDQDGSGRTGEEDAGEAEAEDVAERARAADAAARAQAELLQRRDAQAARRERYAAEHTDLLRDTFTRQEKNWKSSKTFDTDRWNAELADDLEAQALQTVEREGGIAAERLANAGGFDLDRCRAYLRRGAEERAAAINATTAKALEDQAAEDEVDAAFFKDGVHPDATEKQDPFEKAKGERAEEGGFAIATSLSAFSHAEAGRQAPDATSRVKTWVVMSGNSRHPELQGETVPVFEAFSNGGQYPGDPKLGTEVNARCQCLLEVS